MTDNTLIVRRELSDKTRSTIRSAAYDAECKKSTGHLRDLRSQILIST